MAQPLRPTLKERKRYLIYVPASDEEVLGAYETLFGMRGAAKAGIIPVEKSGNKSILRVSNEAVDELKAAIVWSGKKSLKVSGTLKKARGTLAGE